VEQVRADLGDDLPGMGGPTLSVYGSAHLRSAILAARAARTLGPGSAQQARAHERGYVMAGDQAGGLRCLEQARRIAPQQTRHHPMVRETVLAIAAARRGREELSLFASWLGLG
jgi:hypothetical protein